MHGPAAGLHSTAWFVMMLTKHTGDMPSYSAGLYQPVEVRMACLGDQSFLRLAPLWTSTAPIRKVNEYN
jgi:hypothetical protein